MELQLCSDLLFLFTLRKANGIQNKIDRLFCAGFVGCNAIIVKISNHGQIQNTLFGVDV